MNIRLIIRVIKFKEDKKKNVSHALIAVHFNEFPVSYHDEWWSLKKKNSSIPRFSAMIRFWHVSIVYPSTRRPLLLRAHAPITPISALIVVLRWYF